MNRKITRKRDIEKHKTQTQTQADTWLQQELVNASPKIRKRKTKCNCFAKSNIKRDYFDQRPVTYEQIKSRKKRKTKIFPAVKFKPFLLTLHDGR